MTNPPRMKLDAGAKNVLKLIERDKKEDGWASVSSTLFGFLSEKMPSELAVFEPTTEGKGRAKLTEQGQNVLDAMDWL